MIPTVEITPSVPTTAPECTLPGADEVREEGFGLLLGYLVHRSGHRRRGGAGIHEEADILDWLDEMATTPQEFEILAHAIEVQDYGFGSTNSLLPSVISLPDSSTRAIARSG